MKRTLLTSVALSAMLVGASVTAPALTSGFVSPAQAQDATTPPPATTPGTDAPTNDNMDTDTDPMTDPADEDDSMMEDDAAPMDDTAPMDAPATGTPAPSAPMDAPATQTPSTMAPADDATDTMAEPADSMEATGDGAMFVNEQADDEVLSSTYVGQTVYNNADENVGSISDLTFSKDGGVTTAVIGVGGFLGIGQKNVGVNFNSIQIIDDPDSADVRLVIDATREQLEEAPEYFTLEQQIADEQANQPADTTAPMAPAPAPVQ